MFIEFSSADALQRQVDTYFNLIKGENLCDDPSAKTAKDQSAAARKKGSAGESTPATLYGFILHLGFESRKDFDHYEVNGKFAGILKRGRLRIEAEYEKKLHYQSPAGAIFALKSFGWDERADEKPAVNQTITKLQVEFVNTGYTPAASENEVSI